jgi:hypothetical protein
MSFPGPFEQSSSTRLSPIALLAGAAVAAERTESADEEVRFDKFGGARDITMGWTIMASGQRFKLTRRSSSVCPDTGIPADTRLSTPVYP